MTHRAPAGLPETSPGRTAPGDGRAERDARLFQRWRSVRQRDAAIAEDADWRPQAPISWMSAVSRLGRAQRVSESEERRPGPAGGGRSGGGRGWVSVDTMRAAWPRMRLPRGRGRQRCQRRPGGCRDVGHRFRNVCPVHPDALAGPWLAHGLAGQIRRRRGRVRSGCPPDSTPCAAAGIDPNRVVLDPGIGFAKRRNTTGRCCAGWNNWLSVGRPLLVGASRKRFLGALLSDDGQPRDIDGREDATVAVTTLAAAADVWAVRVHSPRSSADAVR